MDGHLAENVMTVLCACAMNGLKSMTWEEAEKLIKEYSEEHGDEWLVIGDEVAVYSHVCAYIAEDGYPYGRGRSDIPVTEIQVEENTQ